MNKALGLINWDRGGRYYVLKATSFDKWVGFEESVINKLRSKFGDKFFIVIWTDESKEYDFFNIPFEKLKHVFTEEHKTSGINADRWTATILEDNFLMHNNRDLAISIREDYGNLHAEKKR